MLRRYLLRSAIGLGLALLAGAAVAQQLTVSAAASLTETLRDIGRLFEAQHPGVTLRLNFAASGVLVQQIAKGAPVDVFVSADEDSLRRGIDSGLIDSASRQDFATNQLVLVVPAALATSPPVSTLADLAKTAVRRIALGKPATVPAGRYAREVLEAAGLWSAISAKLIQADNVRQVLDYVARGEVEAGFVYRTDAALLSGSVRVVQAFSGRVRYPAAVVSDSRHKALAREFVAFLITAPAQGVLRRHGFGAP